MDLLGAALIAVGFYILKELLSGGSEEPEVKTTIERKNEYDEGSKTLIQETRIRRTIRPVERDELEAYLGG